MRTAIKVFDTSVIAAYQSAGNETKKCLEKLFPNVDFSKPVNIMDRVKTWDDVVDELGYDPVERLLNHTERGDGFNFEPDEIAYIKLKAIATVLNEGWTPQFTTDEYRWFPWFYLYTQDEIDKMSEEKRSRVVRRSSYNAHASGGVAYAYAHYDSSFAHSSYGSRLAFKTRELAEYAGKRFADIWADFVFRPKAKSVDFSEAGNGKEG